MQGRQSRNSSSMVSCLYEFDLKNLLFWSGINLFKKLQFEGFSDILPKI